VIVSVDLTTTRLDVRLDEPDDCRRFHVAAHGDADPDRLGRVLADHGSGRLDGDDVWVQVEAVRRLAAGRVGAGWESDFAAMLEFARSKGWIDASGTAIRAHVEWT
jgi:hypothetical protein